jgi:hypothetical protein
MRRLLTTYISPRLTLCNLGRIEVFLTALGFDEEVASDPIMWEAVVEYLKKTFSWENWSVPEEAYDVQPNNRGFIDYGFDALNKVVYLPSEY